jgi:hypothetical protein
MVGIAREKPLTNSAFLPSEANTKTWLKQHSRNVLAKSKGESPVNPGPEMTASHS